MFFSEASSSLELSRTYLRSSAAMFCRSTYSVCKNCKEALCLWWRGVLTRQSQPKRISQMKHLLNRSESSGVVLNDIVDVTQEMLSKRRRHQANLFLTDRFQMSISLRYIIKMVRLAKENIYKTVLQHLER